MDTHLYSDKRREIRWTYLHTHLPPHIHLSCMPNAFASGLTPKIIKKFKEENSESNFESRSESVSVSECESECESKSKSESEFE